MLVRAVLALCHHEAFYWVLGFRGQRFHFTCVRCSQLYFQFILQAMAGISAELTAEEQMKAYIDAILQSDKLLSARVREHKT